MKNEVTSLRENVERLTQELETSEKARESLEDRLSNVDKTWDKRVSRQLLCPKAYVGLQSLVLVS